MRSLIFAGGFATRLYPVTLNRAKALLEYRGQPVINYAVQKIPRDIPVMISTNKKFEADFHRWKQSQDRLLEVLIEEALTDDQKKGAVGAIDYWIKMLNIKEDLLVIAADNYFDFPIKDMLESYNGRNTLIAVHDVGDKEKACEIGKACQVGLVIMEGNTIKRLDEKPAEPTSSVIATGIYLLPPAVFPLLDEFCRQGKRDNLGTLASFLITRVEVQAYLFKEAWMDIGDEIKRGRIVV